jgi:predicted TIM-barrel fold metal-dependent hydrolase
MGPGLGISCLRRLDRWSKLSGSENRRNSSRATTSPGRLRLTRCEYSLIIARYRRIEKGGIAVPLLESMKLFSVDDHLIEPPHLWQTYLPEKYRENGPRVVESKASAVSVSSVGGSAANLFSARGVEKGDQVWVYEGRIYPNIGLNAVVGKPKEEWTGDPLRFDDMRPGCWDPVERIKDMDIDGVWGSVCFPNFARFAGTLFLTDAEDRDLALACVSAYNDYVTEEWAGTAPDRLVAICILPVWDIDACVSEIQRVAAKGAHGVTMPENPVPLGLPSYHQPYWEPVFAAAQDNDLTLCMHFGTSGSLPQPHEDGPPLMWLALLGVNSMTCAVDLVLSPVFTKFPRLRVALSEGGIGWIPYILERCDHMWENHKHYQDINKEVPPSEIFRRHIFGCFIEDAAGLELRHAIGIDQIMWECDYPHSDTTWPNSWATVAEMCKSIPDDEVHRIVELNARRVFRMKG